MKVDAQETLHAYVLRSEVGRGKPLPQKDRKITSRDTRGKGVQSKLVITKVAKPEKNESKGFASYWSFEKRQ